MGYHSNHSAGEFVPMYLAENQFYICKLTVNGLLVLMMMVKILRGAQEMKKTAEMRKRMMFVLLLFWAFLRILDEAVDFMIFLVEALKMK